MQNTRSYPAFNTHNNLLLEALSVIYQQLNPTHCFVAKVEPLNTEITTLCYIKQGQYCANFCYQLAGTPCKAVIDTEQDVCFPQQVQSYFCDGLMLKDMCIQGYLGILLRTQDNSVVGLLVCLFEQEIASQEQHLQWISEHRDYVALLFFQQHASHRIQQLEKRLEEAEKLSNIGSWRYALIEGHYWCSSEIYHLFELNVATAKLTFQQVLQSIHQDDKDSYQQTLTAIKTGSLQKYETIYRINREDGGVKYLLEKAEVKQSSGYQSLYLEGKVQDITPLYQFSPNKKLTDFVFEHTSEAVMITNNLNRIIFVNKAMLQITGYSRSELIDQNPNILSSNRHSAEFYNAMWDTLSTTDHWRGELWNKRKNGKVYPEELSVNVVRNEEGDISHYVAIFRDISQWKKIEKELRFYAEREPLTGLINRRVFNERLNHQLALITNDEEIAVLFIDLDDFKLINDIYGHEIGDLLLKTVAERLSVTLSTNDLLCRYGGDEFTVMLTNSNLQKTQNVVRKIRDCFQRFFNLNDHIIEVTATIGVAMYPETEASSTVLLRHANFAMRYAKNRGRNGISFHDSDLQQTYQKKLYLKERLKTALKEKKLQVYYQPIVDIKRNRVAKFEALVRWPDDRGSFISPSEFIPIAEEFGLIHKIGEFVLRQACQDLKAIHRLGYDYISFSINRSINEFIREELEHSAIASIVKAAGVPYQSIIIEITESTAMSDNHYAKQALTDLRRTGIKIALDDFCTGYSSLNYLIDYEIDIIKIDRSFIDRIAKDTKSKILISAVIDLAAKLDIEVIAEGVESETQLAFLRENHCYNIQGFYYSPAIPISECKALLARDLNHQKYALTHLKTA